MVLIGLEMDEQGPRFELSFRDKILEFRTGIGILGAIIALYGLPMSAALSIVLDTIGTDMEAKGLHMAHEFGDPKIGFRCLKCRKELDPKPEVLEAHRALVTEDQITVTCALMLKEFEP